MIFYSPVLTSNLSEVGPKIVQACPWAVVHNIRIEGYLNLLIDATGFNLEDVGVCVLLQFAVIGDLLRGWVYLQVSGRIRDARERDLERGRTRVSVYLNER